MEHRWTNSRGIFISGGTAALAVVLAFMVLWEMNRNPRTDDASVRANYIQFAPEVSGRMRTSLEKHLRTIAAALEQRGSFADTDVHPAATAEAPSYVRNSVEIYQELRLESCEIASC